MDRTKKRSNDKKDWLFGKLMSCNHTPFEILHLGYRSSENLSPNDKLPLPCISIKSAISLPVDNKSVAPPLVPQVQPLQHQF